MHVSAQRQQPKFLAARHAQLILDVFLAGQLDRPAELLDKPLSFLRLRCLLSYYGSKASASLLQQRALVTDTMLAPMLPSVEPNLRKKVMEERVEVAVRAWRMSRGDGTAQGSATTAANDIATMWKLLVDKGLLSGQI